MAGVHTLEWTAPPFAFASRCEERRRERDRTRGRHCLAFAFGANPMVLRLVIWLRQPSLNSGCNS